MAKKQQKVTNKKLILGLCWLFLVLLMLNLVAADGWNWDNSKRYDSKINKVTVENNFGLGSDVASFKLETPHEVGVFAHSKPQIVHTWDVNFTEAEDNVFNDNEFYDLNKGMKQIGRPYRWMIEVEDVGNEYEYIIEQEDVCKTDKNGTYYCDKVTSKSEMRKRYKWIPIEDNVVAAGTHKIGLETIVRKGDYIEFIPTILGVRMPEFAVWNDTLDDSLWYTTNMTSPVVNATGAIFSDIDRGFPLLNSSGLKLNVDVTHLPKGIDTSAGYLSRAGQSPLNGSVGTIAIWMQVPWDGDDAVGTQNFIYSDVADYFRFAKQTSGDQYFKFNNGNTMDVQGSGWWVAGEWVLLVIKFYCTGPDYSELWANNVKVANTSTGCTPQAVQNGFWYGSNPGASTQYMTGNTTTFFYWYRNLTISEMTSLYAGGAGMEYGAPDPAPVITLESPANNTEQANNYETFNCSGLDDTHMVNLTLYINDVAENTIYNSSLNDTALNMSHLEEGMSFGSYNWTCKGYDDAGSEGTTVYRFLNITAQAPTVTQNQPVDYYNTTSTTVTLNCSSTDDTGSVNLTMNIGGVVNTTVYNSTANETLSIQTAYTYSDGLFNWSCDAYDSADLLGSSSVRYFTVDTIPPDITLSVPINTTYSDNTTLTNSTQLIINWTAGADANTCWWSIDNNGTNFTVACGDTGTLQNTTYGPHNITFWVNDSLNNVNSTTISATWSFIIYEFAQDFVKFVNEMKTHTFNISIIYDSSTFTTITANLVHNWTSYIGTKTGSGDHVNFTRSIDIPVTNGQVNKTVYWDILLTNTTGTYHHNSSIGTQQINETLFVACNATYGTHHLVNFTLFKETDKSAMSANFEATFNYYIGAGTDKKNYSIDTAVTNQSFCSNFNDTFFVDSIINLDNITFFEERTYEFNHNYTSTTTNVPLFMLPTGNGTNVIIQLRDAGLVPLQGYTIEIERYYPETNDYELVISQETDIYGQTIARLVENVVKYRFKFKDGSGATRKRTGDMFIACRASPCILPFVIEDTADDFGRLENVSDYDWTFSFSNVTNIFTFTWNDVSGVSATNWLEVKRMLWNGTTTVCNTSASTSSGSLTCDVGSSKADYQAQVYRRVGSGDWRRIGVLSVEVSADWPTFGKEGMIWSFFLLMTALVLGYWKPPVGFATFGLGIVLLGYMNIISLAPTIVIAFLVIIGLAIWSWRG